MALDPSNVEKFFSGIMQDVNVTKTRGGEKMPRKSKSPNTGPGKENITPKKTATKNEGRMSRKRVTEPLKPLNTDRKTPKKKEALVPATKGATPTPVKPKATKKQQNLPKIVIYQDSEKGQPRRGRELSKSWEGRKSAPAGSKSPKARTCPKRNRHSFNDLTSLKSPKKNENGKADKPRPLKLKPDDPKFAEMLAKLEILFPGVDPEFLKAQFLKFKGSLSETIEFVLLKEKTDELPTRADYMKRRETEKLHNKFLENFSVESFLKIIPDPWGHFLNTDRHNSTRYAAHSLHYLKNKFKDHYVRTIQEALAKNNQSLYLAHKDLKKKNKLTKMRATNRSKNECGAGKPANFDIQFVHEVAFIENESKIRAHIKKAEADKKKRYQQAEREGTFLECQSCNELRLLSEEAVSCPANHNFCKDCVVKYVETEVDKSNFQFKCLVKCQEKFLLNTLKDVLSPGLVAKIINRNQLEEIKSASFEHLVHCPFCYCVGVVPPELSVLKCLNPSCLAESCRHCKQLNHIPLGCHELDKFDKTITEESAAASPLRCVRCTKECVKNEDSNKVDCRCGATMCSVCRQPFPECPHFNEPGEEPSRELSSSASSCSDDTEYTEADEDEAGDGDSSTDVLNFLPSGSDSF